MKWALRRLVSMPKSYAEIAVKKTGCFGEIVGAWLQSHLLPQSCCGGNHALLVLFVGGWMQIWPWLCEQSNGVSSLWPCHYEILGVSRESDCWGSLWWLLSSNSKECAKLVRIGRTTCFRQWQTFWMSPQKISLYYGLTGRTTDNSIGKRSQAGLSLLEDIDYQLQ